jgi:hypothetical protein
VTLRDRCVSGRALQVLHYIQWMEILGEIEPDELGAMQLILTTQTVAAWALLRITQRLAAGTDFGRALGALYGA